MSSRFDWQSALIIRVLRSLAVLPFIVLQLLGFVIGSVIAVLPLSFNRVAQKNIALCFPHLSSSQQRRLARKSVRNTIITAFEQAALWCAPPERLAPQITGDLASENLLQSGLAQGNGTLVLAPHISSWEISQGFVCGRYKFCAVYKPLRKKAMENFILSSRNRAGMVLLPTTPAGLRKVYAALKDNQIVCILPDQVPGRNNGVFSTFFGHPVWTMTLINKLVRKTNAAVVMGACYRRGIGKGFQLECIPVDKRIADDDPVVAARAMNEAIEHVILKAPEQYHWIYKRFKVQPDGCKIYK